MDLTNAEQQVTHGTIAIERAYAKTPARVFAAFADPAKKRRWFVEGKGFEVQHFELDFTIGGWERSRFTFTAASPVQGMSGANDTVYQDIIPDTRIVFAYTMTVGGNRISASLVTIELRPAAPGTSLHFTEQIAFFTGADGLAMREAGWRKLLEQLAGELAG